MQEWAQNQRGPFIDQVVFQYQSITGAKNDIDFPPMMIYSLPTPFYSDRPIDHKLLKKTICEGLKITSTSVSSGTLATLSFSLWVGCFFWLLLQEKL